MVQNYGVRVIEGNHDSSTPLYIIIICSSFLSRGFVFVFVLFCLECSGKASIPPYAWKHFLFFSFFSGRGNHQTSEIFLTMLFGIVKNKTPLWNMGCLRKQERCKMQSVQTVWFCWNAAVLGNRPKPLLNCQVSRIPWLFLSVKCYIWLHSFWLTRLKATHQPYIQKLPGAWHEYLLSPGSEAPSQSLWSSHRWGCYTHVQLPRHTLVSHCGNGMLE